MSKEDIIGGLRIALSKGQKLEEAMQSFYNAGYVKEDIEIAAKELYYEIQQQQNPLAQIQPKQTPLQQPQQIQTPQPQKQTQQNTQPTQSSQYQKPQTQNTPQANYNASMSNQYPSSIIQPPKTTALPPPPKKNENVNQNQYQERSNSETSTLPTLEEIQQRYKPLANQTQLPQTKQIVSDYSTPKKKFDFLTIALIVVLVLLFGILVSVFVFKSQIVELLNKYL